MTPDAPDDHARPDRPELRRLKAWHVCALVAIVAGALALRLAYVQEQRRDILFDHPVLDEDRYVQEGRSLARGEASAPEAYWQPPGIVYYLCAVFRAAGPGLLWPRVIQAIVSALSCLLLFLLARRCCSVGLALVAAALLGVHGVAVFAAAELLAPTWVLFLDLVALWLLCRADERRCLVSALFAGLALGLSAVFAPVILPFALVALVWLGRRSTGWRRAGLPVALALGVALPIVPVAVRNYRQGGEVVLVSANGGLNFFLGNNSRASETLAIRPGRHFEDLTTEPRRAAGIEKPGAASRYFYRQTWGYIRSVPVDALAGFGRKVYLFINGAEIPRDTDIYEARAESRLLKALIWPGTPKLPDGLIIPLALLGLVAAWPQRRQFSLLYTFLLLQTVVVAAFFVTSRYRVPALPILALFAVLGAEGLVGALRESPGRAGLLVSSLLIGLIVVCNLPTRETQMSFRGERDFYRGLAYLRQRHQPLPAIARLRRATDAAPGDPRAWFELGNALEEAHRPGEAIAAWQRAGAADPWDTRPRRQAAFALASRGDVDGAIRALQANVDSLAREARHYVHEYSELAVLFARQRDYRRSLAEMEHVLRLDQEHFRRRIRIFVDALPDEREITDAGYLMAVGDLCERAGERGAATQAFQRAEALAGSDAATRRAIEARLSALAAKPGA
jgi:4-amino-4-deoxy-L-arabinose transferase-like glycosyltransferase